MIDVYTDGACSGNPGAGGWGFVYELDGIRVERSGGSVDTTNNRMELVAAIEAIRELSSTDTHLTIWSDSQYVVKGVTEWSPNWVRKDFKGVKNSDLWRTLLDLAGPHIQWRWVRGHNGHPLNTAADKLAVQASKRYKR